MKNPLAMRFLFHRALDGLGLILLILFKVLGLVATSRPFSREAIKRILVIRTDRIGDLVLSTPAFRALRNHFSHAHITCLTAPGTREIVEGNPCIDNVITYERPIIGSLVRFIRFIAGIRRTGFDMAVVLNYSPDAILLAYLSRSPVRIGTWIPGFKRFLTESISYQERDRPGRHEVECVLDVLRNIGIDGSNKTLYLPLSERGEQFADYFIKENNLDKEIIVALHPGSRQPRMRWSRKGFAQVADTLIRENGVKVVIIQGPGEEALIKEVLSMMREEALVTSRDMTITELISLLNRCSLFIGNSTGPMHLAAGVKVPVIALFGNTGFMDNSEKWAPWGENHVAINLPLNSFETCGKEVLGVEDVLKASRQLIDRRKGRSIALNNSEGKITLC